MPWVPYFGNDRSYDVHTQTAIPLPKLHALRHRTAVYYSSPASDVQTSADEAKAAKWRV